LEIVYPDIDAAEAKQTLVEFSELFSEPLELTIVASGGRIKQRHKLVQERGE